MIDWQSAGFRVAGSYSDGRQALDAFLKESCDVVLTDIKMPVMDGIQLVSRIRELGFENTQVVYISGYDDFRYAQQATSLGAVEYILKPTTPDRIMDALRIAKKKLDGISAVRERLSALSSITETSRLSCIYHAFNILRESPESSGGVLENLDGFCSSGPEERFLGVYTYYLLGSGDTAGAVRKALEGIGPCITLEQNRTGASLCFVTDEPVATKRALADAEARLSAIVDGAIISGAGQWRAKGCGKVLLRVN